MEQQEPRKSFVQNLRKFLELVELNDSFLELLKNHSNKCYVDEAMKFEDDMTKKSVIFLEFTRERSTCDEMVEILRKSGQIEAANLLEKYNTSPGFMPYSDEINLDVTPADALRSGGSKHFIMDQKPRGTCLIINNVKDELIKESLRFEFVFKQLLFDVEHCFNMTAKEMEFKLKDLSKKERLKDDNALIVMIISHGQDEKVIGFDKNELKVSKIVDIFSENNCRSMSRKPKLFFFNCCRINKFPVQEKISVIEEVETISQNWMKENRYTLICFACAENYKSWYLPNQFSHFGQALSHCIAQFACEKSVQSILNFTCERLLESTDSTEIKCQKITRDLFFNPGLPKNVT